MSGTNTLAYFGATSMTKRKGLLTLTPFEEKEWPDWSLSVARTEAQTVKKRS